jgi:hypothetical protein
MRDDGGAGVLALDTPGPAASCRREGDTATSSTSPRIGDPNRDGPVSSSRRTDNGLRAFSPPAAPLPLLFPPVT